MLMIMISQISGIENDQSVRLQVGRGEVFVTFQVAQSDYFRRDGPDVHSDAQISIAQAVLGGTIRVAGVYETQTVSVSRVIYFLWFSLFCLELIYNSFFF